MFNFQKPFPVLPNLKSPCWYNGQRELRCLPSFFLIGIPKCGTTDVFNMLSLHPDFRFTAKEQHWFAKRRFNEPFQTGTLDQYTKAMAASLVQAVRQKTYVGKVYQSFHEVTIGEFLKNRHQMILGMYTLAALQYGHHY